MARPEVDNTPHSAPAMRRKKPPATGDLEEQIAALIRTEYPDLRAAWQRLFRSRPPKKLGRETLELAVAWKLQERARGGAWRVDQKATDGPRPIAEEQR